MALARVEARTTPIDCPNCAKTAETEIKKIPGVANARVDLLSAKVCYTFDPSQTDATALRRRIEGLGHFRFVDETKASGSRLPFSRSLGWSLFAAVIVYGIGALLRFGFGLDGAGNVTFIAATLIGGWDILRRALIAAKHRRLDINSLMALAILGAIIIGDLHEAVVVVLLFSLANLLESYSLWRLSRTLSGLSEFTSHRALLKRGAELIEIDPEKLVPGDTIVLKEGMRVPADGVVTSGRSFVDLSSLTGETHPCSIGPGDEVYAGAVNQDGYLEVTVSATVENSRIGRILQLVGEAASRKARVERVVDRFARIYTPLVIALAVLVATVPPLFFDAPFSVWFYKALVFLVVSCPCALVISTPVAITTALSAASRLKAVFKGGDTLEQMASISTVAFDKTGTLTTGALGLVATETVDSLTSSQALQIAASLEQVSQHPIARALTVAAAKAQLPLLPVNAARAQPGIGVSGVIGGRQFELVAGEERIEAASGGRAVRLKGNGIDIASFRLCDELRPEAAEIIGHLREEGITTIGILSGDGSQATAAAAARLKLDFAHGSLLPEHKYEQLEKLGGGVAMVGDGINDVVALSGADVSISMAGFGSDIPAQHADIILFGNSLTALPKLFRLGKRTLATIKFNIGLAFAVKVIFLILAAFGYAGLWMAVLADMGASLVVIFNSLRLLRQ